MHRTGSLDLAHRLDLKLNPVYFDRFRSKRQISFRISLANLTGLLVIRVQEQHKVKINFWVISSCAVHNECKAAH